MRELKLQPENTIVDIPDLNRFQIGDHVIVDANADYDRFEGVIIGIELRRMHGSNYLVPSITILHDGCITDEFKPINCRKVEAPAPQKNVVGIKTSIDTMREAAKELLVKNGWKPGSQLSGHSVAGLMAEFGMRVQAGEVGCDYPDCGCCADAACADAVKQHPDLGGAYKELSVAHFLSKTVVERELSRLKSGSFAHQVGALLKKAGVEVNGDILHDCVARAALGASEVEA